MQFEVCLQQVNETYKSDLQTYSEGVCRTSLVVRLQSAVASILQNHGCKTNEYMPNYAWERKTEQ
jgi:hypothetical protein